MDGDVNGKYRAPALDKGLDIIEFLAQSPDGLTQAEIAKGIGRGTNEIYRMLNTLVRRSYVTMIGGDKYMLSLKLLVLANVHPPRRRLLDIAEPLMRTAAQSAVQSCHLAVWEDGDVVIASAFSGPGNWRLSLRPGAVIGAFNTGSGMALLAFQSREGRARMLAEHQLVRGEKAPAPSELQSALDAIAAQGFARGASETAQGVTNLAFPILDTSGHALACLTCPFVNRIDDETAPALDEVTPIFEQTALQISRQISGA
ncbi:MAG: IclR family transcriptional regulator [Pseudomonadota bacterium]